jgi:hypothetical protein
MRCSCFKFREDQTVFMGPWSEKHTLTSTAVQFRPFSRFILAHTCPVPWRGGDDGVKHGGINVPWIISALAMATPVPPDQRPRFLSAEFQIGRCVRPRFAFGMQQQFPSRAGHQINHTDTDVRIDFDGIATRFAGTKHQRPDCFAEIGHVIVVHPATS